MKSSGEMTGRGLAIVLVTLMLTATAAVADPDEFAGIAPDLPSADPPPASFLHILGGSAASAVMYAPIGMMIGGAAGAVAIGGDSSGWNGLVIVAGGFLGGLAVGTVTAATGAHRANHHRGNAGLVAVTALATSVGMVAWATESHETAPWLLLIPASIVSSSIMEYVSTPRPMRIQAGLWLPESGAPGPSVRLAF